jgi:hypothetical protein
MSRSTTPERRRRERRRLWKHQNGKCHWCQTDMIMAYSGRAHVNGKKPHPKLATIDHLHPKGHPERGTHNGKSTHVLACWLCNQRRNEEFRQSLPREVLWAQSGRSPQERTVEELQE